jgi:hypothetical protein
VGIIAGRLFRPDCRCDRQALPDRIVVDAAEAFDGALAVGTPLFFDIGVFLVVLGTILTLLLKS